MLYGKMTYEVVVELQKNRDLTKEELEELEFNECVFGGGSQDAQCCTAIRGINFQAYELQNIKTYVNRHHCNIGSRDIRWYNANWAELELENLLNFGDLTKTRLWQLNYIAKKENPDKNIYGLNEAFKAMGEKGDEIKKFFSEKEKIMAKMTAEKAYKEALKLQKKNKMTKEKLQELQFIVCEKQDEKIIKAFAINIEGANPKQLELACLQKQAEKGSIDYAGLKKLNVEFANIELENLLQFEGLTVQKLEYLQWIVMRGDKEDQDKFNSLIEDGGIYNIDEKFEISM